MKAIIGITGPIAAGKSTVDAMLRDLGAGPIIDADTVVHDLYTSSRPLQEAIAAAFGPAVRRPDGTIDRQALGARVFGDPVALRRLEGIVHPATRVEVRARLASAGPDAVAVVDAVKLLQGELANRCTERWWIAADPRAQLFRLVEGRGLARDDAERRLAAQPRLEDWRHMIDRVIDNTGTLAHTQRQVEAAWRVLTAARASGDRP